MKKVYIASPVRPVLDALKDIGFSLDLAMKSVRTIAINGCQAVKNMVGYIPISPILAFDGVYDEYRDRERIDEACEALLLCCDALYIVDTPYNEKSKGIDREIELAKKHNIPILEVAHGYQTLS